MITVEGLGGKGTLWTTLDFSPSAAIPVTPGFTLLEASKQGITSASPFECYMPPTGGDSVWYSCSTTQYGPRVSKLQVGTLFGVTNSPDTPNPCEHSTITGGILLSDSDPLKRPSWRFPIDVDPSGVVYYTPNGARVYFATGTSAANSGTRLAYNRKGELVLFGADMSNLGLWNTRHTLLTDWTDLSGSSNPRFVAGAKCGMLLSTMYPIMETFSKGTSLVRYNCQHVSANVWKEDWLYEYHQNASYIPPKPVSSETGYGYVASSIRRVRTHTMDSIQARTDTHFRGSFSVHEETSWWGHSPAAPVAKYFSNSMVRDYSFISTLSVMLPGKSVGGLVAKEKFDRYCVQAFPRAVQLYRCKDATTARSYAIADVKGLDSNWLENLSQVGGTAEVLTPLLLGWKAFVTGDLNTARHALCGAYLSYKYVVSPNISDYHDVKDNFGNTFRSFTKYRFSNERRRGRIQLKSPVCETSADLTYTCTLNLQLKDSSFAAVFNALEKLGIDPSSPGTLWDLIPFSFVVDWFTHIGPYLKNLDAMNNNVQLRNVKSRIEAFKVQWPITVQDLIWMDFADISVTDPLKYSWYDRRVLSGVGSFDPYAGQSTNGLSVSQMTQAGALLSSFKK